MSQKDRKKWLAALAIVLVLVALCIALWQTGLLERLKNVEQLQAYLASHTPGRSSSSSASNCAASSSPPSPAISLLPPAAPPLGFGLGSSSP